MRTRRFLAALAAGFLANVGAVWLVFDVVPGPALARVAAAVVAAGGMAWVLSRALTLWVEAADEH